MADAKAREAHVSKRLARSAARLAAVQALYQIEMTGEDWRKVVTEFGEHRLGAEIEGVQYHDADPQHFRAIVDGVIARQSEIDRLTDAALVSRWPLGRIDPILRAVFRSAGYELIVRTDIPPKVILGEYVDVAKAFFSEGSESRFVNGVMDHMARAARPDAFAPPPGGA